jgi:hypothetical protein
MVCCSEGKQSVMRYALCTIFICHLGLSSDCSLYYLIFFDLSCYITMDMADHQVNTDQLRGTVRIY